MRYRVGKYLGYRGSSYGIRYPPGLLRYLASSLPTAVYVICIVVKKGYYCLNVLGGQGRGSC